MNKKHTTDMINESVSQAYESTLEDALQRTTHADSDFQHLIEIISDDIKLASQLKADEIVNLKNSIMRDLLDAAHHMNETGKELKDWLGFDLILIKNELWKNFTEATDKATLELQKLKYIAEYSEYHTGEIIGLGTLICDQCKAVLHFHQPGHIPPCGKCHGTRFHRQHRAN